MVHQEGDKAVAEALLHHNAGGAVGHVVVGDFLVGLVAAAVNQVLHVLAVLVAVGNQGPVFQHGAIALGDVQGHVGLGDVGFHRVGVVGQGAALRVAVEGAQVARVVLAVELVQGHGLKAPHVAELHVGVVGAQLGPVVVGAEVQVLVGVGL